MGSSGSGRFTDYPGTKAKTAEGNGAGISGGASGVDRCQQAFHVLLEDVGNSDYYTQFKSVPAAGDELEIVFDTKRVFAVNKEGLKVGALPTSHNFLVACLNSGMTYVGVVKEATGSPVPTITADFVPKK